VEDCDETMFRCQAVPGATVWPSRFAQRCPCFPRALAAGQPGSGVSLDPAWSPNGAQLAYVKAPTLLTSAWPLNSWYAAHAIYLLDAHTNTTRRVGTIDGASVPNWSGNGRDLLYESGDGLWLTPLGSGTPVEIEHPLYSGAEWNTRAGHLAGIAYYGQIPWDQQFSWSSP
jgi:hypothetical protein